MKEKKYTDPKISINKVYTKTGDSGYTSIVGGHKFIKSDLRIKVFGEIDYLNCSLGTCLSEYSINDKNTELYDYLIKVQNELFNLGNMIATLKEDFNPKMPSVDENSIKKMEKIIDSLNSCLPPLKSFVLPGGCKLSVAFHLSRSICRKCERLAVELSLKEEINPIIIKYLNRLSDLFFVLSRWANCELEASENLWNPNY